MSFVDILFPKMCIGCGREASYICTACEKHLINPEEICPMCCKASIGGWTHKRCSEKYQIDRLIVGLSYKGLVQNCLKKVKYKSHWDIIERLFQLCRFDNLSDMTVTFVPMWEQKRQERGFNQAEIIADLLVPQNPINILKTRLLERTRETKPMYGLSKSERRRNIDQAFKYVGHTTPKRVLLVDDVWTTGSTMRECAKTLKQNGVVEVWAMTLAR